MTGFVQTLIWYISYVISSHQNVAGCGLAIHGKFTSLNRSLCRTNKTKGFIYYRITRLPRSVFLLKMF